MLGIYGVFLITRKNTGFFAFVGIYELSKKNGKLFWRLNSTRQPVGKECDKGYAQEIADNYSGFATYLGEKIDIDGELFLNQTIPVKKEHWSTINA